MIWEIRTRAIFGRGETLASEPFDDEAPARSAFEQRRERAKTNGGRAELRRDGTVVASFSHVAENE